MKTKLLITLLLFFVSTMLAFAGDEDKPVKFLSTLKPTQNYEELGLVWIHVPRSDKVFGSKSEATMMDALEKLEKKGKELGADMVVGVMVIHVNLSDEGLLLYGTAIKFSKQ